MNNKTKYLIKNIVLFSISGLIPKLISFILIPIYTKYLTTFEYGMSDLITITATLLIPILTLDIQDGVLRFSMDKKYKPEDSLSIAFKINFISLITLITILLIISPFKLLNIPNYFYIFLVIVFFVNALYNSITLYCKGIDKIKSIVIATIINSIVTLIFNIVLLIIFNLGITGFIIANSLGMILSTLYLIISNRLYKYILLKTNKELYNEMKKYCSPLIISVIAWWINSASDRYILTWISGAAISGIYAISYKIPNLLLIFQNILYQAWSISAIKDFDKHDSDGFIGSIFNMMFVFMCVSCSLILILNKVLASILYSGDFYIAWKYVPPLLLGNVFNAMALFLGGLFTAAKASKKLSLTTVIGAIINTLLNFVLISKYGPLGAAFATMIGYGTVYFLRLLLIKKYITMKYNLLKHLLLYSLLLIQIILALTTKQSYQIFVFSIIIVICRKDIMLIISSLINKIIRKKQFS